jgi:glutaredoxin-like protein
MPLFDEKVGKQIAGILAGMRDPVNLAFFTQETECRSCADAHDFAAGISSLSEKIRLSVYDFEKDRATADAIGVDKIPAFALSDGAGRDLRVKFYGVPGGYEINSFLTSLLEASGNREQLPLPVASRVAAVVRDVHIQVFVSLTCPYCPGAVSTAHRLAMENRKIRADMIDGGLFPHLVQKYRVSGVPRTVINESHDLAGAQPIEMLLDVIEKL